jgi:hypothetical protein
MTIGCGLGASRLEVGVDDDGALRPPGPQDRRLVAAPGTFELRAGVDDLRPPRACATDAPVVPVAIASKVVGPAPRSEPTDRTLHVVSTRLGLDASLAIGSRTDCDSAEDQPGQSWSVTCSFIESHSTLGLARDGDALWLRTGHSSYDGRTDVGLGGVQLPCGARVRFPRVVLRERGGPAFGR